jgi:hypothetical protein
VSILAANQGVNSSIGLTSTKFTLTHELTQSVIIVVLASINRASVRLDDASHAASVVLIQTSQVLLIELSNLHRC